MLLIINKTQFGYHTDYYKYCEYLKEDFNIKFLCFDVGHRKLEMERVHIIYVPYIGSKLFRGGLFFLYSLFAILKNKGIVIVHYFENCEILKKIFSKKKMILDIRTLSVHNNYEQRIIHNKRLEKACSFFDFVTVISEGIQSKLRLDRCKSSILPLGADTISETNKDFSEIKLLYVGTLNGRNIPDTVEGLSIFLRSTKCKKLISYDIVGDGAEFVKLQEMVDRLNLNGIVTLHGRVAHFELKPFFDKCNIGVSYIPMTDYYNFQPPTKTFEYINSGMVCIATNTYENRVIINKENGILCKDNPDSFAMALMYICEHNDFDSDQIRDLSSQYSWETIVNDKLIPILERN